VKEGKLQSNVRAQIANELANFNDKRVEITIKRLSAKRSDRQNRLYWLYVSIIAKEIGYAKNELHEIMKWQFLKREKVNEKTGSVMYYTISTTSLNKLEFADMVTEIIQWAALEFDIVLPLPEEQTQLL
jgi:hypothetical protein